MREHIGLTYSIAHASLWGNDPDGREHEHAQQP